MGHCRLLTSVSDPRFIREKPVANLLSRPLRENPGEVLAMRVEDNQPQNHYDDWQHYIARMQERVIQNYVHYHRPKKYQTEGHVPIHKQQSTTRNL